MNLVDEFQEVELCELTNDRVGDIDEPQASEKGLRLGFDVAAIEAGVPLLIIVVVLEHTEAYATAIGMEAREHLAMMWL